MSRILGAIRARAGDLVGWRRWLAALGLGAMAAGALPPFHMVPLLLPALVGVVFLADGCRRWRAAAAVGWWFGFGHFLVGFYWISNALLTRAEEFAWAVPFAVPMLAAGIALFPTLAFWLTAVAARRGAGRILMLAAAWTSTEWLRSWVLTGFPWNPLGSVWTPFASPSQSVALFGVFGLTLLTLLAFALPAVLADSDGETPRRARLPVALTGLILLLALWFGGSQRLAGVPPVAEQDRVAGVQLRLVQPNINQRDKWRADLRQGHVMNQIGMSVSAPPPGIEVPSPTHVIWGETMVPYFLPDDERLRAVVARAVPDGGLLITGAPRRTPEGEPLQIWNSLVALDRTGAVRGLYDKFHLVPFGEYVPLRSVLPLETIAPGATDYSAGPGPVTLWLPGLPPVSPLICYEVIFPGHVTAAEGPRPEWILNITNDAWFGQSAGPYQHFAAARLRAIEEGLPLVRVANTGISAVVDPFGRVVGMLELGRRGVVDSFLPRPAPVATPFSRYGEWILFGLLLLTAGIGWISGGAGLSRKG